MTLTKLCEAQEQVVLVAQTEMISAFVSISIWIKYGLQCALQSNLTISTIWQFLFK